MNFFRFLIFSTIILALLVGGLFYFQFSPPQKKTKEERFVIKLDTSEKQAIDDLKEKGFLKNKKIFELVLDFICWQKKTCPQVFVSPQGKVQSKIESGAYMISKNMNVYELVKKLIAGPYQKWVIIPPGKRKEQVALILQKSLNWPFSNARQFVNTAQEGYLCPDTYLIDVNYSSEQVWQKLLSNFNDHFDANIQKSLLAQNIRNDTAIKIASLIERESGGSEDKPIISGIIWKRLNKKMKLEIDATVQYAIVLETLDEVGLQDLNDFNFWPPLGAGIVRTVSSPYNTYLIKALPEGPICSPSIESIRAVANPAETDALYYLHSSDKKIHTAKTFKEHQENIEKYLK